MGEEKIVPCKECGKILHLVNWRTEKKPDGTLAKLVDAWCINDGCSRKNVLGVIDLLPQE